MAKAAKCPSKCPAPAMPKGNDERGKFVERNLAAINPLREQFAPTPAEPVRQKFRMAGGC